jgi:hypothetical protein
MNNFDDFLCPDNIGTFPFHLEEHNKRLLRHDLQVMILRNKSSEYFDIFEFRNKHNITLEDMEKILASVIEELENKGWKWTLCYGNTGLYVYKDAPPAELW